MEQTLEGGEVIHRMKRKPKAIAAPVVGDSEAQAYAMRVWSGQSVDVPRAERIERCMNALRGQNLPTDGLSFP
jgi:hypothetical protein